jgi:inosine-uridine nucleoside N-ribohydrolase
MPTLPVVIDTDPGIDDLVALTLALRARELRVTAITTTYGNVDLSRTTRNLWALLEHLRLDTIPVFPGADRPLVRPPMTGSHTHGTTGVGYAPVPAHESVQADPRALLRALDCTSGPVTVVTLGPLTNLALAVRTEPGWVRSRIQRHVGMFGSLSVRAGSDRWADFNAWSDPEAVAEVLEAGLHTTMVGLDVTHRLVLSPREVATFRTAGDPLVEWLGGALQFSVESHAQRGYGDGCRVHDVLPIMEVTVPGSLTLAQRSLTVDFGEGDHRGRTVESSDGTAVSVAVDVDLTSARASLRRVFPTLSSQ